MDRYLDELRKLRALVPAASLMLGVLLSPATVSDAYIGLCARWGSGERNMAPAVRSALLAGEIFRFGGSSLVLA
jgi:hypothetical protein